MGTGPIIAGVAAYGIWGFFPIYFHLLAPTGPVEILCHRILWSLVVMAAALTWRRDFGWIRPLLGRPRQLAELALAAVLIAVNWLIYVWAVEQDRVVDAALGYFINPITYTNTQSLEIFVVKGVEGSVISLQRNPAVPAGQSLIHLR